MEFKTLQIKENFPLRNFSTFRIGGLAKFYIEISRLSDLPLVFDFVKKNNLDHFILGGGSNLLISDAGIDGLVINLNIKGLEVIESKAGNVWIKVGSGQVWDEVVAWAVNKNLWGIENLSLIPGRVGGFVMQNVGAYGQEASQVIVSVELFDIRDQSIKILDNKDCQFSYRQSIFNSSGKGRYVILGVTIRLNKTGRPNLTYPDVAGCFTAQQIKQPFLQEIRDAIISIRSSKLPAENELGSAGSFFKNVVLDVAAFKTLEQRINQEFGGDILAVLNQVKIEINGMVKIPTAFIIDKLLGLRGQQVGGARIYDKQALVIVNYSGEATANDVMSLFKQVRQLVYDKTGLELIPEPMLVGFSREELDDYFSLS